MNRFLPLFTLCVNCYLFTNEIDNQKELLPNKKKIIVLTSKGGGGHTEASKALKYYLKDKYELEIINPIPDLFASFDPVRKLTFNSWAAEDLYNYFLKGKWNRCINALSNFGKWFVRLKKTSMETALEEYFQSTKPDLVISVIPFINGVVYNVTQKMDIPFLIIPTDLDTSYFTYDIESPKYEKFMYTLAFDDEMLFNKIKDSKIPRSKIEILGYPLKQTFFEEKNIDKIKEDFSIIKNKPVVMILMGAQGSSSLYTYVYHLAKNKNPIHLVVCLGKNEDIRKKISKIKLRKHVTMSMIGFTDRIADLMAASDVIITKSGSHSVCEAIQTGVPILIDSISFSIYWERMNADFIKKHCLGDVVKNYRKINTLVTKSINDKEYIEKVKDSLKKFKRSDFGFPLRNLIEKMIN